MFIIGNDETSHEMVIPSHSLLRVDKKSNKNIGIYNIGYITIKKSMIMKVVIASWNKNLYVTLQTKLNLFLILLAS